MIFMHYGRLRIMITYARPSREKLRVFMDHVLFEVLLIEVADLKQLKSHIV